MSALEDILRQEFAARGTLPFARFMQLALYHPDHGYYEREEPRIGRHGDYFTSVSVGSVFGELLAFQFAQWLEDIPRQPPHESPIGTGILPVRSTPNQAGEEARSRLQIVEAGAHDGRLAADILGWLQSHRPELRGAVEYWLVEPSPRRQEWQRATLTDCRASVRWAASLSEIARLSGGVRGILFSNELLDALPVHRLGWDAGRRRWFEWGVQVREGQFGWTRLPLPEDTPVFHGLDGLPDALRPDRLPEPLLDVLPEGYTLEVCPAALAWWREAAQALHHGRLLTIDYGCTAGNWLRPERPGGTLRAYHQHQVVADLLANPGEQDLTANVNFSALEAVGESAGLKTVGLASQEQFFVRVLRQMQAHHQHSANWSRERARQFHTLIHPDHLGRAFRVLTQSR